MAGINRLYFTLYDKDLSGTMLASNLKFEGCRIETVLHGGFGPFYGRLRLDDYHAYLWYSEYHNARLVVQSSLRQVAWEGRVEDIALLPGYGVEVYGFGYWRNCFDVPLKDTSSWSSGTHYPEDIIEQVIRRCCRQIQHNFVNFEATNRNVAPYKIEQLRYPNEIIRELLEGGDKWGNPVYFAVWDNRLPYIFVKSTTVKWYVRLQDVERNSLKLRRSLEPMANAVIVEYSVRGQSGDVNDSGTATGETSGNLITLTDTSKGWDPQQWNTGFDVAITAGTGSGQVRDILDTRVAPAVTDSGQVNDFDAGTSTSGNPFPWTLANALVDVSKSWSTDQWKDINDPYYVEIISGPCAGQSRAIVSNSASVLQVDSDWVQDDGQYPSTYGGSVYHIYKPNVLRDTDKSWTADAYNDGYVVEIVAGRGAAQRRNITDTLSDRLIVEPDWDTQPDNTSRYEIHQVAEVVAAGKATGGSQNTLEDSTRSWTTDQYANDYEVVIISGACANQRARIVSNTATTLTVEPIWDDDTPDTTTRYEIRQIKEKAQEESEEGNCNQLVVTTPWTTQPDATSQYEIRQKREGGTLQRTTTHVSGYAIRDMKLCRKRVFSLGTTTPGEAERVAGRLRASLRDPQQRSSPFIIRRVFNTAWVEYPLIHVRAGDIIEIVDLFSGQGETEELDAMRRFFIVRTLYDQRRQTLTITPDTVEAEIATLIASARR